MNLQHVYYFPGLPGLYKIVGELKSGLAIESIADGKRTFASGRGSFGNLAGAGLFVLTPPEKENEKPVPSLMPLEEVFQRMKASSATIPSTKADNKQVIDYMKSLITNLDEESNHASFIKKIISWYLLLDEKVDLMLLASVAK